MTLRIEVAGPGPWSTSPDGKARLHGTPFYSKGRPITVAEARARLEHHFGYRIRLLSEVLS